MKKYMTASDGFTTTTTAPARPRSCPVGWDRSAGGAWTANGGMATGNPERNVGGKNAKKRPEKVAFSNPQGACLSRKSDISKPPARR